ncbi:MAG: hypothetical protein Q7U74_02285, partial [Saprospiraceae bacterium]|nr:hypothetical protein [Saprospiraceae bacterium]
MNSSFKNQFLLLLVFTLAGTACKQKSAESNAASTPSSPATTANTTPLTMEQTSDGKWVILNGQKTVVYEVFMYDNGPDYASEG